MLNKSSGGPLAWKSKIQPGQGGFKLEVQHQQLNLA
jgi:hypothetical protein